MSFNGIMLRDAEEITNGWGNYFKNLYTPDNLERFDSQFHDNVMSNIARLNRVLFQYNTPNDNIATVDDKLIDALIRKGKRGKAPGVDKISYEHFVFGGNILRKILSKLFTAMIKYSHIPKDMKKGLIITLFKGGNKIRSDPNSYRAITLTSVFMRLFEGVLLQKIEQTRPIVTDPLQCGFQKGLSCLSTSFVLKESIYRCIENQSKLFVCFLDAKQAFDRVWHEGLFSKIYSTGMDVSIYKAFINMYTDLESRVRFRGFLSDWFPVMRGTRQGGVSSPKLYLLYIDGLIKELKDSGLGLCLYENNLASPTVADDMCLVTLSKGALDQMMNICFRYSCKWRYEYNARKCAVIVFNDTYRHVHVDKRQWMLGRDPVDEKFDYTHLGVKLSKFLSVGVCVSEAADKLRASFFRLVSCGLHDQGVNPLTSFKIYRSVVLPKALYGCELWDNISNDDLLKLERSHRKCLRFMQGLPRSTRSDVVLSMIGSRSLEGEIDCRKLIFFEQMCNLPDTFVAKTIFLNRVVSYYDRPYQKKGFVPDIYRIFGKYGLIHVLNHFVASGQFPSKIAWKYLIKCSIDKYETASRIARMRSDTYLLSYAKICPI